MNNEKLKDAKRGGNKVDKSRITCNNANKFLKLVWKVHEVARGKGALSRNRSVPHVKSIWKTHEQICKVNEIGNIF